MKIALAVGLLLLGIVSTGVSFKVHSNREIKRVHVNQTHPSAASTRRNGEFNIEGRVINAAGEAVAGATVFADLNSDLNGMIATDTSDREGRFSIPISSLGTYTIYGSKEEDGYPLTISGFHQQVRLDQVPKITVSEPKTVTDVVLQLGEKAAILDGDLQDANTNQAIKAATIILRRADNLDALYRTSSDTAHPGHFRVVVPLSAPFTVEIESKGYKPWKFRSQDQDETVALKKGESKHLSVKLRKLAQ
jgi:hypothetical protein